MYFYAILTVYKKKMTEVWKFLIEYNLNTENQRI